MKPYANPEAFKQALEARIRKAAPTNIGRFRQVLVFDRFLARVHQQFGERVMVKGGVVLELRLDRARATKDVDLRLTGDPKQVLADLQAAGRLELGDRLSFEIAPRRAWIHVRAKIAVELRPPVTSARLALIAETAADLAEREQARVEAPRALRDAQDAAQNESAATSNKARPMRGEHNGHAPNCGLPAPLG